MKYFVLLLFVSFIVQTFTHSVNLMKIKADEVKCSPNCKICEEGICTRCNRGLYSFKNACFESCPFSTFADNYTNSCLTKDKKPFYKKAYSISSCGNSCGKRFHDCSCKSTCKKSGDCCSDYQICEIIEKNHSLECEEPNCKFCSQDRKVCLQCKDNFFYNNGKCVVSCPKNQKGNTQNVCVEIEVDKSEGKCPHGLFLHQGRCLKNCPIGLRANRIDFTCKNEKEFAFYWIFPSRESCENKCGDSSMSDCSCKFTCLRRGNCCDNFEKECLDEISKEKCGKLCDKCLNGKCESCKAHSEIKEGKCDCEPKFEYNAEEDICFSPKVDKKLSMRKSSNYKSESKDDNSLKDQKLVFLAKRHRNSEDIDSSGQENQHSGKISLDLETANKPLHFTSNSSLNNSLDHNISSKDFNKLSNSLTTHLKSTFFKLMGLMKSEETSSNDGMAVYLNGNISMNIMDGNVGTRIINRKEYIINSHNTDSHSTRNLNSHNNLNKITKQGNVKKEINNGAINLGNRIQNDKLRGTFRKIDIGSQGNIQHERGFGENSNFNINNNAYSAPKFHDVRHFTINENINQHAQGNINIISEASPSKAKFSTSSNQKVLPHIYSIGQKKVNSSHEDTFKQDFNKVSQIQSPISQSNGIYKGLTYDQKIFDNSTNEQNSTKSLVIGENNTIKDNHLIHNIIEVRNSYIIPAKNLTQVLNANASSTLDQINHEILPQTVIVVNAQKNISPNRISNTTMSPSIRKLA